MLTPVPTFAAKNPKTGAGSTGPSKPTGAESNSYKYNDATGLWENDHYTWDPVTKQTKPKHAKDYSYNPDTKMWDTKDWAYDSPSGKYKENIKSAPSAPINNQASANTKPVASASTKTTAKETSSDNDTNNKEDGSYSIESTTNAKGAFDLFYNADISNNISSKAATGDASVIKNTKAGDATTGDALAMSNIFNMLQSSWGDLRNEGIVSFVTNIMGNVVGDLFIDPAAIAGNTSVNQKKDIDIDVNVANRGTINNNIDLAAQSGNAAVAKNTAGGNATSGSANAMANVVNMINSIIGSGKSFFGLVNIHGNLEGDILLPDQFLKNLLASNAPSATVDMSKVTNVNTLANVTNKQTTNNDINLAAKSGGATVDGNTAAGNATTGQANTKLTVFNLTGQKVIGSNSLLVFVNVLGEWVGMIVDAPDATAAALGSGDTTIKDTTNLNANLNVENTGAINNNINLAANSGNASVSRNTAAGHATSGGATASANILNVNNSDFNLADWFGILFINVFGSWHGSFGIDTAMGNRPASPNTTPVASLGSGSSAPPQVFQFAPSSDGTYQARQVNYTPQIEQQVLAAAINTESGPNDPSRVAAAATSNNDTTPTVSGAVQTAKKNWWVPAVGSIIGLSLLGFERLLSVLQRRRLVSPQS